MARRKRVAGTAAAGLSLMMNVPVVIGLRLAKIGRAPRAARAEVSRMVTEKMSAAAEAQAIMVQALTRGTPPTGAERVIRLYARKVAANRKRLSKS